MSRATKAFRPERPLPRFPLRPLLKLPVSGKATERIRCSRSHDFATASFKAPEASQWATSWLLSELGE